MKNSRWSGAAREVQPLLHHSCEQPLKGIDMALGDVIDHEVEV